MRVLTDTSATLIDALIAALRACDAAPDGLVRPAAVLWTDPDQHWLPLKTVLLQCLPEMLVLGDYEPAARTGPAIWIRCVVDQTLNDHPIPTDRIPIVYLPGVARQDLRAGEHCSDALQPLVELMYRGTVWLQRGGHDWTVTAFLTSPSGLNLDLARDQGTRDALMRALREVAVTPVGQFLGHRLEAEDFDRLLSSDAVGDLLRWMSEPTAAKERIGPEQWTAFVNQCREKLNFDPEVDGSLVAGERLGISEGPWSEVWERFEEAPGSYPGIPDLLRRSRPMNFLLERSRWPDLNEAEENAVRAALNAIPNLRHGEACAKVLELEQQHAERREWVWARLGYSPMARVLKPLARLAATATSSIGGSTPDEIAIRYVDGAWEGDAASWEAVALAVPADEDLIKRTVRTLLQHWLDETTRAFQRSVKGHPLPGKGYQGTVVAAPGGCLLFTDGLRYDVGRRLAEGLEGRGCRVSISRRWAALPTVTATAKPAVSPVAGDISGGELSETFEPNFRATGKPVDAVTLRHAMTMQGYQIVGGTDSPRAEDEPLGWLEAGLLDERGHDLQDDFPHHIGQELERLAERILNLLDAGWTSVRVVTDHGWLLLPGGLPKVDLPRYMTESRWKRCAVVAGESQVDVAVLPWHWNTAQHFATSPGITCFNASPSYAHGGVSIQECMVPDLLVERGTRSPAWAQIRSVTWRGMRCFVEAQSIESRVIADLRLERPNGKSVVASAKPLDDDGTVSLVVAEDAYEDANFVLVLMDESGTVLAQLNTKVGDAL